MCKEVSDSCCQRRTGKRTFTLNVSDFPNADFYQDNPYTHTQFLPIVGLLRQTRVLGLKQQ